MSEMLPLGASSNAAAPVPIPAGHPQVSFGRVGVLLLNLGTPEATTYWPMRRYLKEFLSDRRVIEVNRVLWWFILHLMVLSRRPFASGEAYKAIWNAELNESPLRTITRNQARRLAGLTASNPRLYVDWAMRYGTPTIASRLNALQAQGCDRILLFPLYPQYCAATTATACDKAFDALKSLRWQPAIRVVPPYYDDPAYIQALAASVQGQLARLDFQPDVVVASFHGLPREYVERGDPYYCHCAKTTRLLREALGWPAERLLLTFQSRFGSKEWLKPYTAEAIAELAHRGIKRLAVVTPGFAADCVETLEEMGIRGAETFREHGGARYATLACLNDSPEGIAALMSIMRRELSGWADL